MPIFRPLKDTFERQVGVFRLQLYVFSGKPDFIASASEVSPAIKAELIVLNAPFSAGLAAHLIGDEDAARLIEIVPMHLIGHFHASKSSLDLRARELLKLVLRPRARAGNRSDMPLIRAGSQLRGLML